MAYDPPSQMIPGIPSQENILYDRDLPLARKSRTDWYDWALSFLIGMLISGYPAISFLSIPFGIYGENSRALTIPYRAFMLTFSLSLLLVAWHRKRLTIEGKLRKMFLLFWAAYLARLAYETISDPGALTLDATYYWAYAAGLCFTCNLVLFHKFPAAVMRHAPWFVWTFSLIAILSGVLFRREELSLFERSPGTEILNPISFAACAVTLILLSGYFALQQGSRRRLAGLATATLPAVYILAVAASRGPLITLMVGMMFLLTLGVKQGASVKILIGTSLVIIALPLGISYLIAEGSALTTRFLEFYQDARGGVELDRFVLWNSAWQQFLTNPILGRGIEIIGVGYPHNLLIESLMATGFFGALVFFSFVFLNIRASIASMSSDLTAWTGLLFVQELSHGMVSGGLYCFPEFWATTLLVAGGVVFHSVSHRDHSRGGSRF